MTHKSSLAPPVCHVSAHNNYIKCFYKLSWHGLFVTSGRHRGSVDLAELLRVVFPGWGLEKPQKFLLCRVEWFSWGSTLGLDGSWEPDCSGRAWVWCEQQKLNLQASWMCVDGASGLHMLERWKTRAAAAQLSSKSLWRCHAPRGFCC